MKINSLLVIRTNNQGLVNIIIAPDEVGGGSVLAARGRHFDIRTPMGAVVSRGAAVAGMPCQAVTFETVAALRRDHADRVWVVADVAQMRVSNEALGRYLDAGFFLIVTGSKFYTGPPFSGALIIPAGSQELATSSALPKGLWDYFTVVDVPARWAGPHPTFTRAVNIGLLVRWAAGLAEMRAFHAVPLTDRKRYFIDFRNEIRALIAQSPQFDMVDAPILPRPRSGRGETRDHIQTIFTFTIRIGGELVDMADATAIYHWLNRDISRHLPVFVTSSFSGQ